MVLKLSKLVVYILLATIVAMLLVMNIVIDVNISWLEKVDMYLTNIYTVIFTGMLIVTLLLIKKFSEFLNEKAKMLLIVFGIACYIIISIILVSVYRKEPTADSLKVHNAAVEIIEGSASPESTDYLRKYPNQIGITSVLVGIYKIFNTLDYQVIRYINVLCNFITITMLYLIFKRISDKNEQNKFMFFVVILSFYPLLLLSTFVYGDFIGLSASCVGIYCLMRYISEEKIRYLIIAAFAMATAYLVRTNYLIFIIASEIYLFLGFIDIFKQTRLNEKVTQIILMVVFLVISVGLGSTYTKYIQKRFDFVDKSMPINAWIYTGMLESPGLANGWYNIGVTVLGFVDIESAEEKCEEGISERLEYFTSNPMYATKFYLKKITSMWAETTYQSVMYNTYPPLNLLEYWDEWMEEGTLYGDFAAGTIHDWLEYYGKAINILMYSGVLLYLLKFRKDININAMYIMIIFLGGFFFHIIWEGKSRYVLPYFIMIIPIGVTGISAVSFRIKKKIEENKNKLIENKKELIDVK